MHSKLLVDLFFHATLWRHTWLFKRNGSLYTSSEGTFFFNILISLTKGRGKGCSVKIEILLTSREFKNQVNFGSWSEIVLKLTLLPQLLFHSHSAGKGGEQTATYHYVYLFEK